MAMSVGSKPSTWSDSLSGLSQRVYDSLKTDNFLLTENQLMYKSDGTPTTNALEAAFTEPVTQRNTRVLQSKIFAYDISKSVYDEIVTNARTSTNISASTTGTTTCAAGAGSITAATASQTGATGTIS